MNATEAQWTEEEGLRFEIAKEVLSDEIGRRNVAMRSVPEDDAERGRLRWERTAIVHLKANLGIHDERRISAILQRDMDEALRDDAPMLRVG